MSLRDNMRKRLGTKELDIGDIASMLKDGKQVDALKYLLKATPQKDRIRIVSNLFIRSKYKAYKLGMAKFNEVIEKYVNHNDRKALQEYIVSARKEEQETPVLSNNAYFNIIRRNILEDAQENYYEASCEAVLYLYGEAGWIADNVKLTVAIGELVTNKWPDNTAIKVLFGN